MTHAAAVAVNNKAKFKWVGRYDPGAKLFRLCRWGGNVYSKLPPHCITSNACITRFEGHVFKYGWQFSIGLRPKLFQFRRELYGWIVTLFGVRLHYQRSYGGMYAG